MEDFKKHLQGAIDACADLPDKSDEEKMQIKGDLMRLFYASTGDRPSV